MEVIGSPPCPRWVKISGVPLQVWREWVFRLLGGCLGRTVEVDPNTISKEVLTHGRLKILAWKICKLPKEICLWVEDLQFTVVVEEDDAHSRDVSFSQQNE